MTGQEIISTILEILGISPRNLATRIDVIPQRIYDLHKGKTKKISNDVAEAIVRVFPQFNITWLLTGVGDMHGDSDATPNTTSNKLYTTYLLPMSAMGGSLGGFTESTMLHNCEAIVSPIENVDFAITVYGESMSPEYPSGSRVLIKKINPDIFIDYGRVYVLDTPNGVIIKEVQRSETPGYVTCHSKNKDPKFTPFDIKMNDIYGWYNVLMCLSMK